MLTTEARGNVRSFDPFLSDLLSQVYHLHHPAVRNCFNQGTIRRPGHGLEGVRENLLSANAWSAGLTGTATNRIPSLRSNYCLEFLASAWRFPDSAERR